MQNMTATQIARATGISIPYAWQIMHGKRTASLEMALRIYDATGLAYGVLEGLSKREIETARKMVRA